VARASFQDSGIIAFEDHYGQVQAGNLNLRDHVAAAH
jgi:hypothetical protein